VTEDCNRFHRPDCGGAVDCIVNRLPLKRQEVSTGKSLADSIPTAGEVRGDPVDMAASGTGTATQVRLHQTDGKLLRSIEDALTRIGHEEFGICEECGKPISKARLEAVSWTRWCWNCKERQDSRS
jgi:DnaK suppressor protein